MEPRPGCLYVASGLEEIKSWPVACGSFLRVVLRRKNQVGEARAHPGWEKQQIGKAVFLAD